MKKYLLILVSVYGLLSLQLSAESASTQMYADEIEISDSEKYAFAGITGSYLNLVQVYGTEDIYLDSYDWQGLLGVRAGMQTNVWRTMFTYENNFDTYQAFLIEADRTILAGMMGGKGRIYLGASGGWIGYYGDKLQDDIIVEFKDYGYAYGGNVGFMFYLSDRIDLSIDYRYLFTSSSCTLDDIHGSSISLHYFF